MEQVLDIDFVCLCSIIPFGEKVHQLFCCNIKTNFVFSCIITTNIQKTLESTNARSYVAKTYKILHQKMQPLQIAILYSICSLVACNCFFNITFAFVHINWPVTRGEAHPKILPPGKMCWT